MATPFFYDPYFLEPQESSFTYNLSKKASVRFSSTASLQHAPFTRLRLQLNVATLCDLIGHPSPKTLFAEVILAKSVLSCLLSDQTLERMRIRAFTLKPDHLHFLAAVRDAKKKLPNLIGLFKSYTTQEYWKRRREIVETGRVVTPSTCVTKSTREDSRSFRFDGLARDVEAGSCGMKNWPNLKPEHF